MRQRKQSINCENASQEPSPTFVPELGGPAIARSDAFAVVVAKLGFNPLSSAGRETGRFTPAMRHGRRFGREPCLLKSRIKALVWHDEHMAEDVSRGPSQLERVRTR